MSVPITYLVEPTAENWSLKAFDNLFAMTDRKLGSGISGRVFMAIDRVWRRQMACKIVQLKKCQHGFDQDRSDASVRQGHPRSRSQQARLWKEVDILKDLNHVSPANPAQSDEANQLVA